ncbi:hypothetical protein COLO4_22354 [Corchorus olitorius]|uniref:Uncharacterized protein n=1 Tax=Corchorus olitorius TaxID=93759 RepID=A0A1R3IMM6_9ROSI|nr:hypothetical protein COLO4_22354 [Corchorus olitorius]
MGTIFSPHAYFPIQPFFTHYPKTNYSHAPTAKRGLNPSII